MDARDKPPGLHYDALMSLSSDLPTLEDLRSLPLEQLLVSARVDAGGGLEPVQGVNLKLEEAGRIRERHSLLAVGLAEGQEHAGAHVGDERCPVRQAKSLGELVRIFVKETGERVYGRRLDLPPDLQNQQGEYRDQDLWTRSWLDQRIAQHIRSNTSSYTIVSAGPTFGKTAFALGWMRRSQDLAPGEKISATAEGGVRNTGALPALAGWSFIRQSAEDAWTNPVCVVLGLEHRARLRLGMPHDPPKKESPTFRAIEHHDLNAHIDAFLRECSLRSQALGHPIVLLLDAVDEIWGPQGTRPAGQLPRVLPSRLHEGVHIVLTSRPGEHLHDAQRLQHLLHLKMGEQDNPQHCRDDAQAYIDWRAAQWEEKDSRVAQLLRDEKLRQALLGRSESYIFYLRAVLGDHPGLMGDPEIVSLHEQLQRWRDNPNLLPQGTRQLLARSVVRMIWGQPQDTPNQRRRRAMLLGMAAVIRDSSLTEAQLCKLLVSDTGYPGNSLIGDPDESYAALSAQDELDRRASLSGALAQLRACWSRPDGERTQLAWMHLLLKECALAAWVLVWPQDSQWRCDEYYGWEVDEHSPTQELLLAVQALCEQNLAAHEATRRLHHALGRAASRFWHQPGERPSLNWGQEVDAPQPYGRVWGPWHAAMSAEPQSRKVACEWMVDARHLQDAFAAGPQAAREAVPQTWRLLRHDDEVVAVVAKSLKPALDRISQGKLQVAQELWSLLGAWDKVLERDLPQRWKKAATPGAWISVTPGTVQPGITVKEEFQAIYQKFICNPDGTPRWWVMASHWDCCIYDMTDSANQISDQLAVVTQGSFCWAACEAVPSEAAAGEFMGMWIASGSDDGEVRLARVDQDGRVNASIAAGGREAIIRHDKSVRSVALLAAPAESGHPAGLWLASGSDDGQVRLARVGQDGHVDAKVAAGGREAIILHGGRVNSLRLYGATERFGQGSELLLQVETSDGAQGVWGPLVFSAISDGTQSQQRRGVGLVSC